LRSCGLYGASPPGYPILDQQLPPLSPLGGDTPKPEICMSTTLARVLKIVVDTLVVDPEKVNRDAKFVADLNCDTLDVIGVVMAAEEEFDIEIPDQDIEKIITVQDAADTIDRILNKEEPING
jgi:acyl carrier protein